MYVSMHIYVCVCVCVNKYIYICECMNICICVCLCAYIYIYNTNSESLLRKNVHVGEKVFNVIKHVFIKSIKAARTATGLLFKVSVISGCCDEIPVEYSY